MANFKLTCPNNSKHKQFSVTAHIVQEWKVDETGEFIEVITDCTESTHRPDKDDMFICLICGTIARVE